MYFIKKENGSQTRFQVILQKIYEKEKKWSKLFHSLYFIFVHSVTMNKSINMKPMH